MTPRAVGWARTGRGVFGVIMPCHLAAAVTIVVVVGWARWSYGLIALEPARSEVTSCRGMGTTGTECTVHYTVDGKTRSTTVNAAGFGPPAVGDPVPLRVAPDERGADNVSRGQLTTLSVFTFVALVLIAVAVNRVRDLISRADQQPSGTADHPNT